MFEMAYNVSFFDPVCIDRIVLIPRMAQTDPKCNYLLKVVEVIFFKTFRIVSLSGYHSCGIVKASVKQIIGTGIHPLRFDIDPHRVVVLWIFDLIEKIIADHTSPDTLILHIFTDHLVMTLFLIQQLLYLFQGKIFIFFQTFLKNIGQDLFIRQDLFALFIIQSFWFLHDLFPFFLVFHLCFLLFSTLLDTYEKEKTIKNSFRNSKD